MPDTPIPTVEIPRQPTWLYEFQGQREQVTLPVEAHPRRILLVLFALLASIAAALTLGPAVMVIAELPELPILDPPAWDLAFMLPVVLIMTALGLLFAGMALTALLDTLRRGPALILTTDAICDARGSAAAVAWRDVRSLILIRDLRSGMVSSLLLRLRPDAAPPSRRVMFRLGMPLGSHRFRRAKLLIPVWFLAPGIHVLPHAAAEMVRRHGGRVLDTHDMVRQELRLGRGQFRRPPRRPHP